MAYLVITQPGREPYRHELTSGITLGRALDCDVTLPRSSLSRKHCRIEPAYPGAKEWVVIDLDSKNGTIVGRKYVTRHSLEDEDAIQIGEVQMVFHATGFVPQRPGAPEAIETPSELARELEEPPAVNEALPKPIPRPAKPIPRPPIGGEGNHLSDTREMPGERRLLPVARPPAEPKVEPVAGGGASKKTQWVYVVVGVVVVIAVVAGWWVWR
jgi:pSer/pThr/pTyr-binding forkhead associated (FHA) protein